MVFTIILIPETNHVYDVYAYSVAAILSLQFLVHVMLFPMLSVLYFCISIFRRMWAGIALRTGRSGNRMPVGARFSASVQTGPGAHPTSCPTGTEPFPGVTQSGRGVKHQPHIGVEVKGRVQFYPTSTPCLGLRGLF